jgi:hypothetical protein
MSNIFQYRRHRKDRQKAAQQAFDELSMAIRGQLIADRRPQTVQEVADALGEPHQMVQDALEVLAANYDHGFGWGAPIVSVASPDTTIGLYAMLILPRGPLDVDL